MQAYRGMDIGTAKPTRDLLAKLPHKLIDILDPSEQYTAGDFVRRADEACSAITLSGRLPVVAGGTGFYLRNFICGLPAAPPADPDIRAAVMSELASLGPEVLRSELASVDPASAARIHQNDHYRLTRALEIVRATHRPMTDFAPASERRQDRDFLILGLERPREELHSRIDARVDAMFALGLPAEVAKLRAAGCGAGTPGMQAIGYREFFEIETAAMPKGVPDMEAIKERIKLDTRRYAKRQMTYFRALPGIRWIRPEPEILSNLVLAFLADSAVFGL
jgi:tRNA dimethylallyltransferase